jgi:hypothetical protein
MVEAAFLIHPSLNRNRPRKEVRWPALKIGPGHMLKTPLRVISGVLVFLGSMAPPALGPPENRGCSLPQPGI